MSNMDPHPETCRCHPCDRRRIADLEAKNTRLREALSFTTNAIDPEQSDETADWELTDVRWRTRLNEMHAELKRLREWKTDVEDSTRASMDETCDANERHCTCVPLLRRELKRLQCYPNAVLIIRNKYPIDVFPDTNVGGRMARLTCDNILELASERIAEVD